MAGSQRDDVSVRVPLKEFGSRRFWTRSEKKQWIAGLFGGTCLVYMSRTIMPVAIVPCSQEMGWDKSESGMVLSAFFWGYTMTQFLGGYLSDRIGAESVIPIAACMWSLVTFWTPQFANLSTDKHNSLYIMVLSRVLLGIFQGFHYPGVASMISHKVAEHERSLTYSLVLSGSIFGTLLTGWIGSYLTENYGWQMPFYVTGLIGLTWMLILRYTLINKYRKRHLSIQDTAVIDNDEKIKPEPRPSVPWFTLLSKPAFWSILVGHFCQNNAFYILLSWLPTYFHENFPSAKSWVFNVVPWLVTFPCIIISGWVADKMIAGGYSVTFVRKLMETVSLLGIAFFLFIISYASSYTGCLICLASAVACCGFHNSGILVNPQDIAPSHAGSVFGIMNMAGAIPGFIGVYVAGHILESTKSWNAVFHQTAVVCIIGWIAFTLFGTGKKII